MTIKELIDVLIEAPDKSKGVCFEYRADEAVQSEYEWQQMYATSAELYGGGVVIEAHPEKVVSK